MHDHLETESACNLPLLQAALDYAALGWAVVPLHSPDHAGRCSCGSVECNSVGKHPRTPHGFKDATTDPLLIAEWWSKWPSANIGLVTGRDSSLFVVDIDPRHQGDESLADLEDERGSLPHTVESVTGGGGRHLVFAYPPGDAAVRNRAGVLPGLDIRGEGGYIVAPPSHHASGRSYSWLPGHEPGSISLASAPDWLLDLIVEKGGAPTPDLLVTSSVAGSIPMGQRNGTLVSYGGTMRRRGMGENSICAALVEENQRRCCPPLPQSEVEAIAASVSRYAPDSRLVTANLTDLGNAERLLDAFGADVRYVHAWKKWLIWDGTRWAVDDNGAIERRAVSAIREIYVAAAGVDDEKKRKALVDHARRSEAAGRIRAMVSLAANLPDVPVDVRALDVDPWLFNCSSGTIDLRSGEIREFRREDLITKLAPVVYDPSATCAVFDEFLDRIMAGNKALKRFLQKAVGYSLTGSTTEQVLFILYGTGANGKSTLLETIRAMLGDYSRQTDFTTFLQRSSDSVRNDLARLVASRFVSAAEVEEGRRLSEAVVKQATGQDTVSARYLFSEFFEFVPACKVWLAVNHKPEIRGTDHGIWRRIRLLPFEVRIPEDEQDRDLGRKLREELPGILAWAVRGARMWQDEGLVPPEEVREATQDYRSEMDIVGAFLAECCVLEAEATVAASSLNAAWLDWCEKYHETALSNRSLAQRLHERGLEPGKGTHGLRIWKGLRLKCTPMAIATP